MAVLLVLRALPVLLEVVAPEVAPEPLVPPAAVLVLRALRALLVVVAPVLLAVVPEVLQVLPEAAVVCHSQPAANREEVQGSLSLLTSLDKSALPKPSNRVQPVPVLPMLRNPGEPALPMLYLPPTTSRLARPTLSGLVNPANPALPSKVAALPSRQARRVRLLPIGQRLHWGLSLAPILPLSSSRHVLHEVSLTFLVSTIVLLSRCYVEPHQLLPPLKMDVWERVKGIGLFRNSIVCNS